MMGTPNHLRQQNYRDRKRRGTKIVKINVSVEQIRWWLYLTQSGASKPVAAKAEHSAAKAGVRKFVRMPSPFAIQPR